MAYILFTLSVVFIIFATVLYVTRNVWKPYAPPIPYITAPGTIPGPVYSLTNSASNWLHSVRYSRLPSSFQEEAEAGLHSSNFSLAENITEGDSRQGLDEAGKREVYRIMKQRRVTFDEARRLHLQETFGREGIAADGRPLDRKAVMFDR